VKALVEQARAVVASDPETDNNASTTATAADSTEKTTGQ
jgi:hypothetical protein